MIPNPYFFEIQKLSKNNPEWSVQKNIQKSSRETPIKDPALAGGSSSNSNRGTWSTWLSTMFGLVWGEIHRKPWFFLWIMEGPVFFPLNQSNVCWFFRNSCKVGSKSSTNKISQRIAACFGGGIRSIFFSFWDILGTHRIWVSENRYHKFRWLIVMYVMFPIQILTLRYAEWRHWRNPCFFHMDTCH